MKVIRSNSTEPLAENLVMLIAVVNQFYAITHPSKTDLKNAIDPKLQMLLTSLAEISPWLDQGAFAVARDLGKGENRDFGCPERTFRRRAGHESREILHATRFRT